MLKRNNLIPLFLSALLSSCIVLLLSETTTFKQIELATVDTRFQLQPEQNSKNPVVHIDIDDASINTIGRWPWPREIHAEVVEILSELGAKTIVFDVIFPDPQEEQLDNQFLNQYDRIVNRHFDGLLEQQQNLKHIFNNWKKRGSVQKDDLDVLQRNLKKNKLLLDQRKKNLKKIFRRHVIDQDQEFANSIRKAGNVVGGFVIQTTPYRNREELISYLSGSSREQSKIETLINILNKNYKAGIQELVEASTLKPDRIHEIYEPLKKWMARKKVDDYYHSSPSPDLNTLLSRLDIPSNSREESLLKKAFQKKISIHHIEKNHSLSLKGPFPEADEMVPPIPELTRALKDFGHVSVKGSSLDGTMRRVPIVRTCRGKQYPILGLISVLHHLEIPPSKLTMEEGKLTIPTDPPTRVPVNGKGKTLLNWNNTEWERYQGPHLSIKALYDLSTLAKNVDARFQLLKEFNISGLDLLLKERNNLQQRFASRKSINSVENKIFERVDSSLSILEKQENRARKNGANRVADSLKSNIQKLKNTQKTLRAMREKRNVKFKQLGKRIRGKTCLIGSTHTGSTDINPTPVDPDFPQVSIHSTIFDMIYNRKFKQSAPGWLNVFVIILAAFLGALLPSPGNVMRSVLLVLGAGILYTILNQFLFNLGFLINFAGAQTALILSFGGLTTYNLFTVESERRKTKKLFERYVDHSVVKEIMQNPEMVQMGGTRERLTIVFMDLAGFTSLSEKSDPEQVVNLISTFLSEMTNIIFEHRGTIDKYEGDALLAYWGAPIEQQNPENNACMAMLECLNKIPDMNQKIKEELPDLTADRPDILDVRVGVNTGEVVMGNVGSERHADFTVLGDSVNLAARLEAANKFFHTNIIISEETYEPVKYDVKVRKLGRVKVKGREKPVTSYELVGKRGSISTTRKTFLSLYERGRRAYLQRDWESAQDRFRECTKLREDPYCDFLINQIESFKNNPPPLDKDLDLIDLS